MTQIGGRLERWSKMAAERGTWTWLRWRVSVYIVRARLPNPAALKEIIFIIASWPYRWYLRFLTAFRLGALNGAFVSTGRKCLYASPVGAAGKIYLEKIIEKFGHERFDYLIFVWDGTEFHEKIFEKCRFIHERGIKWYFMKKYLTPEFCERYDYIFPWDDDIDVSGFSVDRFLDVMERNHMELAQPSLTNDSYHTLGITLKRNKGIGRYTDFIEIMVPVFKKEAWTKYWRMLEPDWNYWGWGYDDVANSLCGYRFTGIIDCESVRHTRECRKNPGAKMDRDLFIAKHKNSWRALRVSYAGLKDAS